MPAGKGSGYYRGFEVFWFDLMKMEKMMLTMECKETIKIKTGRLILRNVKTEDVAIMYDYRNNEICAKHQRDQTKDYDGIARLVEKRKSDILGVDAPFMVAVALKDTDEMVGEIVVMPEDGTISLGYTFS